MKCLLNKGYQKHIKDWPENTHLLRKGKYHCTADLLLDWFGFGQTSKSVDSLNPTKKLNPLVFSGLTILTIMLQVVQVVWVRSCYKRNFLWGNSFWAIRLAAQKSSTNQNAWNELSKNLCYKISFTIGSRMFDPSSVIRFVEILPLRTNFKPSLAISWVTI